MMWTSVSASESRNRSALNGCGSMNESRSRNTSVTSSPTAGGLQKTVSGESRRVQEVSGSQGSADQGIVIGVFS